MNELSAAFSPTDYRYAVPELWDFCTEAAFVKYKARVEAAVARVFAKRGILREVLCDEIVEAASKVTAEEVRAEEQKTAYEISACLVGSEMCIRDRLNVSTALNEILEPVRAYFERRPELLEVFKKQEVTR